MADAAKRRMQGLVALVCVQFCFGLFPLFVKFANDSVEHAGVRVGPGGFTPNAIAFWRILVGAGFLGLVVPLVYGKRVVPERRDVPRLFLCASLGIVLNQVLAMEGFARTSVLNAGLLCTLIPVFTYAIALAVKQERFSGRRTGGIAIALVGAALLVLWRSGGVEGVYPEQFLGNCLIVINSLSYAGYMVLARPLLKRYSPLVVTMWMFVLGVWCLPFLGLRESVLPESISRDAWLGLGYTLLFATILAYTLNTFALERVSASTTAAFIYLQPLISGIAGMLVLSEVVTLPAALAGALLLAGITLVVRSPSRSAKA